MRALFLDTATQVARHWHADSERQELGRQLGDRKLYCSRYVGCQYRAVLLNSAVALFNLLIHFRDLKRALRESTHYQNAEVAQIPLTSGVQKRIEQIGLWMLEFCSYEEQVQRLQDLIEDVWETQFHQGVELPLIDETGCLYVTDPPEAGESGGYNPAKVWCTLADPQPCRIEQFWESHRTDLELLANMDVDAIKAQPKDTQELEKVKEAARRVRGGKPPRGRCCMVDLSDAIICLESTHCPEAVAVHSTNKKHFRPLCEILGVESEPND
jgi:hypothetical protein